MVAKRLGRTDGQTMQKVAAAASHLSMFPGSLSVGIRPQGQVFHVWSRYITLQMQSLKPINEVKYVEAAGGRVVPILYDWDDQQLAKAERESMSDNIP